MISGIYDKRKINLEFIVNRAPADLVFFRICVFRVQYIVNDNLLRPKAEAFGCNKVVIIRRPSSTVLQQTLKP